MTAEISSEQGIEVDIEAVDAEMEALRARSRASASMFSSDTGADDLYRSFGIEEVPFLGYRTLTADCRGHRHCQRQPTLERGDERATNVEIVLGETPFYAARGGQIGDTGYMRNGANFDSRKRLPSSRMATSTSIPARSRVAAYPSAMS